MEVGMFDSPSTLDITPKIVEAVKAVGLDIAV